VPAYVGDQVRVEAGVTERHVTLVECPSLPRPPWQARLNRNLLGLTTISDMGSHPDAFQVVSDGDWGDEWARDATYPPTGMSTRGLVAELFGECPTESPLTEF
jgi:hypothetical protein